MMRGRRGRSGAIAASWFMSIAVSISYARPGMAAYADLGVVTEVRTVRDAVARDFNTPPYTIDQVIVLGDDAFVGVGSKGYLTLTYRRTNGVWRKDDGKRAVATPFALTLERKRYAGAITTLPTGRPRSDDRMTVCATIARDADVQSASRDVDDVIVAADAAYGRAQTGADSFNVVVRRNGNAGWTHAIALGPTFPDSRALIAVGVSARDARTIVDGLGHRYDTPVFERQPTCARY